MKYLIDKGPILGLFESADPLAQQKTAFLQGSDNNNETADTTFNAMSGFRKESANSAHNHLSNHLQQNVGGVVKTELQKAQEQSRS